MDWFFWVSIHGITFSLQQIIHRSILKFEKDTLTYWFIFQLISALVIFPFINISSFFEQSIPGLLGILTSSILSGIFLYVSLRAYNFIEVSEATIISQTKIIWSFVLAILLLSETLTINKATGTILIVLALIIVYHQNKLTFSYGAKLVLFSTFVFAIKTIVDKLTLGYTSVPIFAFSVSIIPALALLSFRQPILKRSLNLIKKTPFVVVSGILATISLFAIMKSVSLTEVSNVTPVAQAFNMITILIGIIVLNERRDALIKILGGILAIIGVVLIKLS